MMRAFSYHFNLSIPFFSNSLININIFNSFNCVTSYFLIIGDLLTSFIAGNIMWNIEIEIDEKLSLWEMDVI